MLTSDERKAAYIAAMRYGFDDFAQLLNISPSQLRRLLRGEINFQAEKAIRGHWRLVLELLHGSQPRRGHKK